MLFEFDYKAVEAVMVGWYAGDIEYIKAARLGVHAILAASILGRPIKFNGDEELVREAVRSIKVSFPKVYASAKAICHLSNYGGTPFKIRLENPDLFSSVRDAENLQQMYFKTIGKGIRPWQQRTLTEAHRKCYLQNVFRYRHYFWDVLHYDPAKRKDVLGTDANRALAFLPQSTTAGLIKEAMLRIHAADPWFHDKMLLQVHDSLLFDLPDDSRVAEIQSMMEAPLPEMDGLSFEVEVNCGDNWGDMREWLPETRSSR